jgi:hypothetical protein
LKGNKMDRKHSYTNRNKWYGKNNSHKNSNQNKNEESQVKSHFSSHICEYCNQPIEELSSAIAAKENGNPAHFDCVLAKINASEKLAENEKITYIGQGRFAVVYFENPHDLRHFTIRRVIEWENRETTYKWRSEIANVYSQVK